MRQNRTSRNGRNGATRTKSGANRRQPVQNGAATRAATRHIAGDTPISVAEAARTLGTDRRTVRRYIETGSLPAYQTPGGQWRIPPAGIEAIRQGSGPGPSTIATLATSSPLAAKNTRVEELTVDIAEERALTTLQQLRDEKQEAKHRQEEAAQAKEDEQRRVREEDRRERKQRRQEQEREQAAARARRDFEDEKVALALSVVPRDLSEDVVIDVTQAVREKLQELYQSSDDVADRIVIEIARKVSRPYIRLKEAQKATGKALEELSFLARSYSGSALTEWEIRARQYADEAIAKLPETATPEQMVSAARAAGKSADAEYRHNENCQSALVCIEQYVARILPYAGSQERAQAETAVRDAVTGLAVGASRSQIEAARDVVLEPFITAEAKRRSERQATAAKAQADREAAEAKAKLEREADLYLYRVNFYLGELEARPGGWDFAGKQYQCAQQIKQEIRAGLIAELPLDPIAARKRVEKLVDDWLVNHSAAQDSLKQRQS